MSTPALPGPVLPDKSHSVIASWKQGIPISNPLWKWIRTKSMMLIVQQESQEPWAHFVCLFWVLVSFNRTNAQLLKREVDQLALIVGGFHSVIQELWIKQKWTVGSLKQSACWLWGNWWSPPWTQLLMSCVAWECKTLWSVFTFCGDDSPDDGVTPLCGHLSWIMRGLNYPGKFQRKGCLMSFL